MRVASETRIPLEKGHHFIRCQRPGIGARKRCTDCSDNPILVQHDSARCDLGCRVIQTELLETKGGGSESDSVIRKGAFADR